MPRLGTRIKDQRVFLELFLQCFPVLLLLSRFCSTSTLVRSPPSVCPVDNVQTGGVQNLADPEKTVLKVEMDALVKGEPTDLSVEEAALASFMIDLIEQMAIEGTGSLVSPVLPGKQSEEVTCHVPSAVQSVCVPQVGHEEAAVSANLTQSVVLDRPGSLDSGNDRALELLRDADTAITAVVDSSNFLLPVAPLLTSSHSQSASSSSAVQEVIVVSGADRALGLMHEANLPGNRAPSQSSGKARALELPTVANLPGDETPSRSSRRVPAGEPLSGADTLGEVPSSVSEISPSILSHVSHFRVTRHFCIGLL